MVGIFTELAATLSNTSTNRALKKLGDSVTMQISSQARWCHRQNGQNLQMSHLAQTTRKIHGHVAKTLEIVYTFDSTCTVHKLVLSLFPHRLFKNN